MTTLGTNVHLVARRALFGGRGALHQRGAHEEHSRDQRRCGAKQDADSRIRVVDDHPDQWRADGRSRRLRRTVPLRSRVAMSVSASSI